MSDDQRPASAFAFSWNALPAGSVSSRDQFEDWLQPLTARDERAPQNHFLTAAAKPAA
jgi:hypothetical protein